MAADDEKLERDAARMIFSAPTPRAEAEEPAPPRELLGPEIAFVCPFCQEAYSVSEELAGKTIKCRNCRAASRVGSESKPRKRRREGLPFWLGIVVGAVGMAIVSLMLRWLW
jgi:hypothetical protein